MARVAWDHSFKKVGEARIRALIEVDFKIAENLAHGWLSNNTVLCRMKRLDRGKAAIRIYSMSFSSLLKEKAM